MHYETSEAVKLEAIKTVEGLGLVSGLVESFNTILKNASSLLKDAAEGVLLRGGFFANKKQDEAEDEKVQEMTNIMFRSSLYEHMEKRERDIILRGTLVGDAEKESLIEQVMTLCRKGRIISEATGMEYQELKLY
jgi:hypothetical protein